MVRPQNDDDVTKPKMKTETKQDSEKSKAEQYTPPVAIGRAPSNVPMVTPFGQDKRANRKAMLAMESSDSDSDGSK